MVVGVDIMGLRRGGGVRLVMRSRKEEGGDKVGRTGGHRLGGGLTCARGGL